MTSDPPDTAKVEYLPVGLSLAEARLLPTGSTVRRVVTVSPPLEEWID